MNDAHVNNGNGERKPDSSCGCGGGSCGCGRNQWIWLALAVAVAGLLIAKHAGKKPALASQVAGGMPAAVEAAAPQSKPLPRLVDLGAGKCAACKMMTPILEDLQQTYAGSMEVVFIDVWENPDAGKQYGINVIPTQIFYDAAGRELFRHEGFFGRDDILAKWKELGVSL